MWMNNCYIIITIGNRSLTFVLDLTFDLTFCRLFSFFLLRAFFPLKVYGDCSVLQIKQFTLKKQHNIQSDHNLYDKYDDVRGRLAKLLVTNILILKPSHEVGKKYTQIICPFVSYSYYSFESIQGVFNETPGFPFHPCRESLHLMQLAKFTL